MTGGAVATRVAAVVVTYQSASTIDECLIEAAADLSIQTALSEARFLAGNSKNFNRFQKSFSRHLNVRSFFDAKLL